MKEVYINNLDGLNRCIEYYNKQYDDSPTLSDLKDLFNNCIHDGQDIGDQMGFSVSDQYQDRCYLFEVIDVTDEYIFVEFLGMMKG